MAHVVMFDGEFPVCQSTHCDAAQMQEGTAWQGKPGCRTLKKKTPENNRDWDNSVAENLFIRVDIPEKQLECLDALADAFGKRIPVSRGEDLGKKIAEPWTFSPWAIAINIKRDAHFPHGGLKLIIDGLQLSAGGVAKVFE